MPNQTNFIRPQSYNMNANTMKQQQQLSNTELAQKRTSILILTLISMVIFLFILSLLLICALISVGRGLDKKSSFLFADNDNDSISSISLTNQAIRNINKNTIDTSNPKFDKKKTSLSMKKIMESLTFRLPKAISPVNYNILLHPNLTTEMFNGNVKIDFTVSEKVPFVVLHTKALNITKTKLMRQLTNGLEGINVKNTFEYEKFEQFVIEPEVSLDVGNYTVELDFDGSTKGKLTGFYSSTYFHKGKNIKRTIATSKFEPTFARQSFPCFDEPAMKATYEVTLISPEGDGYHALSNMPVKSTEPYGNGLVKYTFDKSVPMSTYLSVFIVSDFDRTTTKVNSNSQYGSEFDVSIYSTPEQVNKTHYALETTKKIIEHYIDYFKIPYPLPKLDLAAIPDFVSGAMETWGLVTYRETNLLYDPLTSSASNKQRICGVIAHEMAHMWFGNLVTMRWWNDLWLNEGFASYIEYKGMDAAEPTWNITDQFAFDNTHGALSLDATLGSHPIVVSVETPEQITEIFDTITYSKGAAIIRMIEDFVGPDNFQKGVTDYLNEMRYLNADSDDLLRNLRKYTSEDVSEIVNTWIRQKGFPVIYVRQVNANNFEVTQKRFLTDPESADKETVTSEYNYRWSIPLTYYTSDDSNNIQRTWFHHNIEKINVTTTSSSFDWIKFNKDQVGYYRVNYEEKLWESLNNALQSDPTILSVADRGHILNDVFSLARAGEITYDTALKMTQFLRNDLSYVPWETVSSDLKKLKNLLYSTEFYKPFLGYINDLLDNSFNSITWNVNNDEYLKNLFRIRIVDLACSFGHIGCLQKMSDMFREWIDSNATIRPHPDLRTSVYYYGMKNSGTEDDWNKVLNYLITETDANEKAKLQNALAAIEDPIILSKLLELAANETYVRNQDYFSLLTSIARDQKFGEGLVWDYVRENWENLVKRFGNGERNLHRMIPNTTSKFAKEIRLEEMKDFFAKYPDAGAGSNARIQAQENIRNNIKWLKNNKKSIGDFLLSQN